ncbi:hypothetical protein DXG01_014478, partial [Tephrocybe rancida]
FPFPCVDVLDGISHIGQSRQHLTDPAFHDPDSPQNRTIRADASGTRGSPSFNVMITAGRARNLATGTYSGIPGVDGLPMKMSLNRFLPQILQPHRLLHASDVARAEELALRYKNETEIQGGYGRIGDISAVEPFRFDGDSAFDHVLLSAERQSASWGSLSLRGHQEMDCAWLAGSSGLLPPLPNDLKLI